MICSEDHLSTGFEVSDEPFKLIQNIQVIEGQKGLAKLVHKFVVYALLEVKCQRTDVVRRRFAEDARGLCYMLSRIRLASEPKDYHARQNVTVTLDLLACLKD